MKVPLLPLFLALRWPQIDSSCRVFCPSRRMEMLCLLGWLKLWRCARQNELNIKTNVTQRIHLHYLNTTGECQEDTHYLGVSRWGGHTGRPLGEVRERLRSQVKPFNSHFLVQLWAHKLSGTVSIWRASTTTPSQWRGLECVCVCVVRGAHILLEKCF